MAKRIGITMRMSETEAYPECRDAIAQDWPVFLNTFFPELEWVLLPNLGKALPHYLETWNLEGFILTGGNDIGEAPLRDQTETILLQYAQEHQLAVIGICRGLQMLQHYAGGSLSLCDPSIHVATTHAVYSPDRNTTWEVNSYHRFGVPLEQLAENLQPLALSEDGFVEALCHQTLPFYAVQWHPERSGPSQAQDIQWMKRWLGLSAAAKVPIPVGGEQP